jgi:hypothetical protein
MRKNIFLCGKCPLTVENISARESFGFAPLGREVTGEAEDKLRGVGGESVVVGTIPMLEVTAPSLAFREETSG